MALFHVFNTVDNRRTGVPMAGVNVRAKFDGTDTIAPIYSDQDGTAFDPANICTTDDDGMFSFYIDAGEYTLEFLVGSVVIKSVPDFRPAEVGPSGPANSSYATTAELESADIANVSAILAEVGKAGTFTTRDYADFTAEVAADTGKVNYIRSVFAPTKVWVRTSILSAAAGQIGAASGLTVDGELAAKATLSGVARTATHLGTFTGSTIPDSATVKAALQAVETAVENTTGNAATKTNATAIGIAATDANMGAYTSPILPDNQTAKENIAAAAASIEGRTHKSIKSDYGAAGDGSTDDTAAFAAAASDGGNVFVPSGAYMIDYISGIDTPLHLHLADGAIIKQRVPSSPATTLDANWGLFEFVAGAEGSSIVGGMLDGNRAALAPYYKGHTRLGQDNHWWAVRTAFVDDFLLKDITIKNVMNEGFYFFGGERCRALNVKVLDSGVLCNAQGNNAYSTGWVLDVYGENIGNVVGGTAYYFFQHGCVIHQLDGPNINVRMVNFYGSANITPIPSTDTNTGGGKEPIPLAISMYKIKRVKGRAYVNGYSGDGVCTAIDLNAITGFDLELTSFDVEAGVNSNTLQDGELMLDLDGNWRADSGFARPGLFATYGGVYDISGAGLAGETTASNTTNNVTVRGKVRRFGIGVTDQGSNITYAPGFDASGNLTDGAQLVGPTGISNPFPASRSRPNGGRKVIGIKARFNGQTGIVYTRGTGDVIRDNDLRDNGQQSGSRVSPYNLWVLADSGQGEYLTIAGNNVDASPVVIDTDGLSYVPGAATAAPANSRYDVNGVFNYVYPFILRNPSNFAVGQFVRLKNVLSGPADVTGKIIDISGDVVTVAFIGAQAFVATSNLDTLTGTGTTSGTTLTGVGTLFASEIDFPVYVKSGSEYRRIAYVNSNTSAVIDSAFTSNLSGAAIQVIRGNVEGGVYQPTHGYVVNDQVTVGPLLLRDNKAKNIPNQIHASSFPGLDEGSRFEVDYSLTMTGTTLDNVIVTGLPAYCQVQNTRINFDTAITGLAGSLAVQVKDNGSLISTPISTWTGFTSGTKHYGPTPEAPALKTTAGSVHFVSGSGNPSGTLTARLTLQKFAYAG